MGESKDASERREDGADEGDDDEGDDERRSGGPRSRVVKTSWEGAIGGSEPVAGSTISVEGGGGGAGLS